MVNNRPYVIIKKRITQSGSGGGGDVNYENDYTLLKNKPKINGVILTGNKSLEDLGISSSGSSSSYGIKGDYATHYGIIKCQEGLIKNTFGSKEITIPAGLQLLMAGDDVKTQIAGDLTYTIESETNFTLFYAEQGTLIEAGDVFYQEEEPNNGISNYVAWFNPAVGKWKFKSNDTGNIWREAKATPIADIYLNENGNIIRIDYIGYRVLNDQIFAQKEDIVGDKIPLSEDDSTSLETKISELEAICNTSISYKPIEANTDLNTKQITGLYIAQTDSIVGTITNKPSDVATPFYLEVIYFSPTAIRQILTTIDGDKYTRTYKDSNWNTWNNEGV